MPFWKYLWCDLTGGCRAECFPVMGLHTALQEPKPRTRLPLSLLLSFSGKGLEWFLGPTKSYPFVRFLDRVLLVVDISPVLIVIEFFFLP